MEGFRRHAIALLVCLVAVVPDRSARAQNAVVTGQVVLADGGQPLGYTSITILPDGRQTLANESGRFLIPDLQAGELRLRFKRIGFTPRDTVVRLAANDTVKLRIALGRLVIQLPEMVVSGKCTNETPSAAQPVVLSELFEQVNQNAERVPLLAKQQPFVLFVYRIRGFRNPANKVIATSIDTVVRKPMPVSPYEPKRVIRTAGYGSVELALPELPDIASAAFTSNHCFTYAGKTLWGTDSVIQVDFEPTPSLNKDVDIKGSVFLKSEGYQLVGSVTTLNKIPNSLRRSGLEGVTVRAKFTEIVPGIPVLDEWEFVSDYGKKRNPGVELGQVLTVKWMDSSGAIVDNTASLVRDDSTVRTFVQRFYDMYQLVRGAQGMEAQAMVLAASPPFLDSTITRLLRDDAAARRVQPAPTRDSLGVDPFLGPPSGCPRYRVGAISMSGDTASAAIHAVCPAAGADSVSKAAVNNALLARRGGRWEIYDFTGPGGSIVARLCELAMADRDSSRRPKSCP